MKSCESPDPELLAAEEDDENVVDETDSALRRGGMKSKMRSSLRSRSQRGDHVDSSKCQIA
jgi:hypothetical protein